MDFQTRDKLHHKLDGAKKIISAIHKTENLIKELEDDRQISSIAMYSTYHFPDLIINKFELTKIIEVCINRIFERP
ncbi:hypothetical protein [Sutcliffiella rhizosphaerae]|uniref:Uncharacterized protein n=1 Tax=Sutcliffiella rhizosphaerae TaxID=2880967 RepID=A0ABM8YLL1_9BACI|nr:hypothetical protein [Sutcliffiella rhizosphaerae]CAG9620846.1 hypothetical protein BACCIP111883_01617 [Sutcliffiella rhizosphaerae]